MSANSLWVIRSNDEEVLSLFEGPDFRTLYDYCDKTWPALLRSDAISALRIR